MFAPHESTRRGVFRLAFVVLAILPTFGLAGWTAMRHLPSYTAAFEQTIAEHTGLTVSLKTVEHPRPGETRLVQLELRDPESGLLIARAERALIRSADDGQLYIHLDGAKLEAGGLAEAWHALDLRLRRQVGELPHGHAHLTADHFTTHAGENPVVLHDVKVDVDCRAVGTEMRMTFRTTEAAGAGEVLLRVVRDRRTIPPTSGFELHSEDAPLPCALAEPLWKAAPWFGPQAQFIGQVEAADSADGSWKSKIVGRFLEVDLKSAIEMHFPPRLRGTAEIVLEEAWLDGDRLTSAKGTITAGPGSIGRDLVERSSRALHLLQNENRLAAMTELSRFESLACAFEVDARGIALSRHPSVKAIVQDGKEIGYPLLVDNVSTVLAIPTAYPSPLQDHWQPMSALVQTLVPATDENIPADDRAAWLLRALPAKQP